MTRINLVLLGVLIACALALVTSQHNARKLFTELEKEQEMAKQIDIEWGQLQLEQSTWAMHCAHREDRCADAADARPAAGARAARVGARGPRATGRDENRSTRPSP